MRILFFAHLQDAVGLNEIEWPGVKSMSTAELWERLIGEFPVLADHRSCVRLARNGAYTSVGELFSAGDEVALIPPVSGG